LSYHWLIGRRHQPPLTALSCQGAVESEKVSPQPPLLQTEQPQLPQRSPSDLFSRLLPSPAVLLWTRSSVLGLQELAGKPKLPAAGRAGGSHRPSSSHQGRELRKQGSCRGGGSSPGTRTGRGDQGNAGAGVDVQHSPCTAASPPGSTEHPSRCSARPGSPITQTSPGSSFLQLHAAEHACQLAVHQYPLRALEPGQIAALGCSRARLLPPQPWRMEGASPSRGPAALSSPAAGRRDGSSQRRARRTPHDGAGDPSRRAQ